MNTKQCTKCKKGKDFSEFYKDKRSKDGLYSSCKECHNLIKPAKDYSKTDRYRAYKKEYNKKNNKKYRRENTEDVKEYQREYQKQYTKKIGSIERKKAFCRQKTLRLIKKGILVRQPCEVCGINKVQAHHKDYNKPLEVMWLCLIHHREWHELNK